MRKVLASMIIGTLIALPVPAFATDDRVNVEKLAFEKIEEYINTYNAQIDANNEKVADIEVPDDDAKSLIQGLRDYYVGKITEYQTKKTEVQALLAVPGADGDQAYLLNIYDELIAIAEMNRQSYQEQLDNFDESQDKASEAKSNAALQTEMGNKQIIWGAEQLFLTYNSLEYQLKQQRAQLFQLYKQINAMKLRQELGLATGATVKGLEKSSKELEFAVNTMVEQQRSIKEQLNIMLNQNYDTGLLIEATPELDDDLLNEMDFDDDYETAEWKSYNVRLEDEDYQEEAAKRKFKADFWKAYNKVSDKQESLELEEFKLETQEEAYEQAQLKYELGLISKLSFDEEELAYNNQVIKVQLAKDDLFKAYREYEWMKRGLTISSN